MESTSTKNSKMNSKMKSKNSNDNTDEHIKFIDLFCGIGSFHHSFKPLGWECVMACDIHAAVRDTYQTNYGMTPMGDITEIDPDQVPAFDLLCAGFPCQPFSQCGQHKGFEDTRGTMFFHLMKFVAKKPRILLLENVQGLLNHDKGNTFRRIQTDLREAGYVLTHKILKCSDYGLPQMRKRLFIIGVRKDTPLVQHLDRLLQFDEYTQTRTLSELLGKNFEKPVAYTIRCGGRHSPIHDKHNWDGYLVDGKEYRLTKEDCLAIQGFPTDFTLCGTHADQWKQLGNTIPTRFTEIIGKNLQKYLNTKV
jgi:DNA (cytosine-5)-methyltransferase 1